MRKLYASVDNCSNIISVNVSQSHSASTSTAIVECVNTSLTIGDSVDIDIGYVGDNGRVFRGYVKSIDRQIKDNTYTITMQDRLVRAVDYFVVSSNPATPFSRSNIAVEDLVQDVLALAGLTNYGYDATFFTFATGELPAEVNLVSAYDYCNGLADLLTWHLYCDNNGKTWFVNRKPYVMDGTSGQPSDTPDSAITTINSAKTLAATYKTSEKDLRNRVVVYGAEGIYANAQSASPYLPAGFYKTAVLSSQIIATQALADDIADYNLEALNRLTEEVSCTVEGDHILQARSAVTFNNSLLGLNDLFYIYSADHKLDNSGYTCSLELRK